MLRLLTSSTLALALMATTALARDNPMVGGATMFDSKTIIENADNSADPTTLVAAVKAVGLVDALQGPGSFSMADMAAAGKDGFFNMTTLSGDSLSARMKDKTLYIDDESGNASKVTVGDVFQSNGVIQGGRHGAAGEIIPI